MKRLDVAKNPKDKKWYVIGYCGMNRTTGRQEWMAISSAYPDKNTATKFKEKQYLADAAAKRELSGI